MADDIRKTLYYYNNTWTSSEFTKVEVTLINDDGVAGVVKMNSDDEYAFFPAVTNGVAYQGE